MATQTVIYNCKRCKVARRVQYPIDTTTRHTRRLADGKYMASGVWIVACGGGKPTEYGGDTEMGLCPKCGRAMEYGAIDGRINLERKCDARCTSARGHNCECQCGGENHGSQWAITEAN